jgi:hypothetical protein
MFDGRERGTAVISGSPLATTLGSGSIGLQAICGFALM